MLIHFDEMKVLLRGHIIISYVVEENALTAYAADMAA